MWLLNKSRAFAATTNLDSCPRNLVPSESPDCKMKVPAARRVRIPLSR
jgi:hypothetical protein